MVEKDYRSSYMGNDHFLLLRARYDFDSTKANILKVGDPGPSPLSFTSFQIYSLLVSIG